MNPSRMRSGKVLRTPVVLLWLLVGTSVCVAQIGAGNPTTRPSSPTTNSSGGERPKLVIPYDRYLDQVLGGWIGKSIGGAVGARFEGYKGWVEVAPDKMFPDKLPPNDDLDLQVLWLKVLEERGLGITADDLAAAWLEGCWYPFNEYGIFRRNWRLGIHPPASGRYGNQFWETGMGCPIRAEIWGYVFPGAPDLAARYAGMDGSLDHTEQSIGAEQMFAAMASMAFFVPDVESLARTFLHYLPEGTPIARLTRMALDCHEQGVSLRDARDRIMFAGGVPEACDAQTNVPFTFLALLYGENDTQKTILSAVSCGYDTDCTAATSAALLGQIRGARAISPALRERIGDELVMGIKYRRPDMTLSALARDTARIGVLFSRQAATAVQIADAPAFTPLPETARRASLSVEVEYAGLPAAAPGDRVKVTLHVQGDVPAKTRLSVDGPQGWTIAPADVAVDNLKHSVEVMLHAPREVSEWPMKNLFHARLSTDPPLTYSFGVAGAGLWRFLGVYYDPVPDESNPVQTFRRFNQHFVSLGKAYLPEPDVDAGRLYEEWSRKLGRPAVAVSYENEISLSALVGIRGACCAYLDRTIVSPQERDVYLMVGNSDAYRLYVNSEKVAEVDDCGLWAPFNNGHAVRLRQGPNHILVKLLRRGDDLRFTFAVRENTGACGGNHNCEDWLTDLADEVP